MTPTTQTPLIRLHGAFPFDRGAKARWLMTEMGVAYEDRWLDAEKNEFENPEFLRINPLGRVPAMEIGDQKMFESGAICAYLSDLFLDKGMAPGLTAPERADYQKWMYFAASTIDTFQTRIMIIEDIPAGEYKSEKQEALLTELKDACGVLQNVLTKNSFLVANRFSTADICVSYHLYWLNLWPELESVMKKFPAVGAYLERMAAMPSAKKADVFSYKG
jgi:glutathione S-transferase